MKARYKGPERRARRRLDWDVRGVIAVLALMFAFIIAAGQVVAAVITGRFSSVESISKAAEVPTWIAGVVGSVVGFYFGARSGSNGGEH